MIEEKLLLLERMIELKTIKNEIDISFLNIKDLKRIQDIANKLRIKIAEFDLDEMKYESDDIYNIYNIWSYQINLMCKQQRHRIIKNIKNYKR